jgi:hypothetical protein
MDMYAGGSMGLATMRRDGFASMDANEAGGVLTTRLLTTGHRHLFVNACCEALTMEMLDAEGLTIARSASLAGDNTKQRVVWEEEPTCGAPFRLRFCLKRGQLFAFWFSPSERGESLGYMGAGGPGFTSGRDL